MLFIVRWVVSTSEGVRTRGERIIMGTNVATWILGQLGVRRGFGVRMKTTKADT